MCVDSPYCYNTSGISYIAYKNYVNYYEYDTLKCSYIHIKNILIYVIKI